MEEKQDLRVVKTKKALVGAMIDSLQTKRFEDITVQSLCDMAMVRRATFYTHFADKFELFGYAIRRAYQDFPSFQRVQQPIRTLDVYQQMIEDAINFLTAHMDIFKSLLDSQTMPVVMNIVIHEVEQDILPAVMEDMERNNRQDISPQLTLNYHLYGMFGSFLWWVRNGQPISKEALIAQIHNHMSV